MQSTQTKRPRDPGSPFSRRAVRCVLAQLLVAAAIAPAVAPAQDNGIYLGAALADVTTDFAWRQDILAAAADEDASGYKLIGGFRPLDHLAFEANYSDLGTSKASLSIVCIATIGFPCPNEASIDTQVVSVSALGFATFPLLDLYGRIGFSRWEADGDVRFTNGGAGQTMRMKRNGTDPVLGVGIQFRFSSVALRAEYEHYEILDDSAESLSIGFTYTFL